MVSTPGRRPGRFETNRVEKLPTSYEVDSAMKLVARAMIGRVEGMPETLITELANIHRCLKVARTVIDRAESGDVGG
ncbi:MAG: hypothetical protein V3T23_04495 [Nitrososphaerales archaeon]